jgi:DNA-binding MarR family transcriptional regulator
MKYTVMRQFRDKYTREIYLPGDAFVSDEADRNKDLLTRELIEEVKYDSMTKKEIMDRLEERGIEYSERQTKAELIELLGGD